MRSSAWDGWPNAGSTPRPDPSRADTGDRHAEEARAVRPAGSHRRLRPAHRGPPGIERKGATVPYTSLNGHMTSYLSPEGRSCSALARGPRAVPRGAATTLHTAYGVVQKEFVDVPDALFEDTAATQAWFAASLDWVAGLKPKATAPLRLTRAPRRVCEAGASRRPIPLAIP